MTQRFRLFIDAAEIKNGTCTVTGEGSHYLKNVLRATTGDTVELRDGTNRVHTTTVENISEKNITLKVIGTHSIDTELPIKVTLAQGLPKADKMELIIQKCVELGAHEIIPLETSRSIVKITKDKEKAKVERWNKISRSAAQQSGRGIVPAVSGVQKWSELLGTFKNYDLVLLPWEMEEHISLKNIFEEKNGIYQRILIIIGPEGGFSAQETEDAVRSGARTITLGKRILRTETAGIATLAMLNYIYA